MTEPRRRLVVDWMPESAAKYGAGWAVVCVDVFRATTTACTAVASGHRCFPVSTADQARSTAAELPDSILAGELHGDLIPGFALGNSPAAVSSLDGLSRAIVLLSTSGTRLMRAAGAADVCFVASLRNTTAQVKILGDLDLPVAIIGAGTRGEKRLEDRIGCARIAAGLLEIGFVTDGDTAKDVAALASVPTERCAESPSAAFLRMAGHEEDIDFVIDHDDDLHSGYVLEGPEVVEYS